MATVALRRRAWLRRTAFAILAIAGLILVANLMYAAKSLAGIDLDPGTHHGDWFPLGNWIYERFRPRDPVLSFGGPYRPISVHGKRGEADGEIAAGWQDNSAWGPVTIHYERTPGVRAQRATIARVDPGGAWQFVQWLDAEAGARYTLSARVRADHAMTISAVLRQPRKPFHVIAQASAVISTEWTTLTASGIPADDDIQRSQMLVVLKATELGTVDIASVAVTQE